MDKPGSAAARPLPLLLALAVTAAGVFAMLAGGLALARSLGESIRLQIAVGSFLLAAPALAVLLLRRQPPAATLGLAPAGSRLVLLSIALGAALWVGSVGLMELQSAVIPPPPQYLEAFRAIHRALRPDGPFDAVVSVGVIAVAPGVFEELVCRGVLLPALLPWLGPAGAVSASALLFAAIHLDAYRFAFTLAMGIAFGAVRLRSGSLLPPIVAHVTLNTLTFVLAPLLDDPAETAYTPQPALGLACLLAGTAVAWPLLRALRPPLTEPGAPPRLAG